jgi:hypothetical protein
MVWTRHAGRASTDSQNAEASGVAGQTQCGPLVPSGVPVKLRKVALRELANQRAAIQESLRQTLKDANNTVRRERN